MGTHPIFESDFDCLTDCVNFDAPVFQKERKQFNAVFVSAV